MDIQYNLSIYITIFLIVFIPYVFVSFFMSKPKVVTADLDKRNLPKIFRILWGILSYFSESVGGLAEKMQPYRKAKLQNTLLLANIKMDVGFVFAAELLLAVTLPVVVVLLFLYFTTNGFMLFSLGVICAFVGYIYPSMTLASAADERQNKIMKALPFAIDLIGSAMRSGVDFTAAIRYYVSTEQTSSPLGVEFGIMLRQLELGKTRIEAIEDMSKRIQTDAFSSFAAAVIHGFEVGASIVETMKIQAEEMRRVRFNIAERKAARAVSAMIFPIAVFIMPAMFLIIGAPVLIKVMGSGLGGLAQ